MTEQPPPGPPQQPPGPPPPPGYPPPGYPPPGYPPPYPPYQFRPRHPQAVTILVLGCVGTAGGVISGLGFLVAPIAWVMGARAKREIEAEPGRWDGEDLINIGYILGIVGTVLLALGLLFTVAVIIAFAGVFSGWL